MNACLSFILCTVFIVTFWLPGQVRAEFWTLEVEPNDRLGVAFPGADTGYYPLLADLGAGVVRLSASWKLIEPKRGRFTFDGLDRRILALDALGIKPFLTFESNAEWAVQKSHPVKNAEPQNMADWVEFIRRVTERYDGDGVDDVAGLNSPVQYFQVANEFLSPTNRSGGWAGTHDALLQYINVAHDTVKAAHPDAIFILGGIAAFNLDSLLLDAGLADFTVQQKWYDGTKTVFDPADLRDPDIRDLIENRFHAIIKEARYDWADVHLYGPEARDMLRLDYMADLTQRPVISAECGGPSLDYTGTYSGHGHFLAVLERNLNVQAAGAKFCLWFGLGEGITATYGNHKVQLYDLDAQEKPGVVAYRLLARLLEPHVNVVQPSPRLFVLEDENHKTCVAFGPDAFSAAAVHCDGKAMCISNAEDRQTETTELLQLQAICPSQGVAFAGRKFWSAIESTK